MEECTQAVLAQAEVRPRVIEKNTFLDFESVLPAVQQRRFRTEPVPNKDHQEGSEVAESMWEEINREIPWQHECVKESSPIKDVASRSRGDESLDSTESDISRVSFDDAEDDDDTVESDYKCAATRRAMMRTEDLRDEMEYDAYSQQQRNFAAGTISQANRRAMIRTEDLRDELDEHSNTQSRANQALDGGVAAAALAAATASRGFVSPLPGDANAMSLYWQWVAANAAAIAAARHLAPPPYPHWAYPRPCSLQPLAALSSPVVGLAQQQPSQPLSDCEQSKDPLRRSPRRQAPRLWIHIVLHMLKDDFDCVPMLIGRRGCNVKPIHEATGAKLRIRGKGSGHKEKDGQEADIPPMVAISTLKRCDADFCSAVQRTLDILKRVGVRYEEFCRERQLVHEGPLFSLGAVPECARAALGSTLDQIPVGPARKAQAQQDMNAAEDWDDESPRI